jgi:hypothetical protein
LSTTRLILAIGDIRLLHHPGPLTAEDTITLVSIPHAVTPGTTPNTVMLSFDSHTSVPAQTRTGDHGPTITSAIALDQITDGLLLGPALQDAIRRAAPTVASEQHTPLVCALRGHDGWHTYSRTHRDHRRWCFIRTSPDPLTRADDPGNAWLDPALAAHAVHVEKLNSNHCTKPPAFAGREVEVKLTLPADAPLWSLAAQLYARLHADAIPNMVPRLGLDFETRDYDNLLLEITAPDEQRGYVSFMGLRGDAYRIKRKTFTTDQLIRSESVSGDIIPDRPPEQYVREVLGLEGRMLPAFRRVRYNIMMESTLTGNHFSILLDRSALLQDEHQALAQCEIEYVRTRRVLPITEEEVLEELHALVDTTSRFLTEQHLPHETGYYSKLSFLRDTLTARSTEESASL